MLYSFNGHSQALQADITYISLLARSAVDPKFCLFFVDLFTSKIYTYPIKKSFSEKMKLFYNDIDKKRLGKMRLRTDQEFKQRNIENLIKKLTLECIAHT